MFHLDVAQDSTAYLYKPDVAGPRDSAATFRNSIISKSFILETQPSSTILALPKRELSKIPLPILQNLSRSICSLDFPSFYDGLRHALFELKISDNDNKTEYTPEFHLILVSLLHNLNIELDNIKDKRAREKLQFITYETYKSIPLRIPNTHAEIHPNILYRILKSKGIDDSVMSVFTKTPQEDYQSVTMSIAYKAMRQVTLEHSAAENKIELAFEQACNEYPNMPFEVEQLKIAAENGRVLTKGEDLYVWRDWINVRLKFELLQRALIDTPLRTCDDLIPDILLLGADFREFEFSWYWFERATILSWKILIAAVKLCRVAVVGNDPIWLARSWAVYKHVVSMKQAAIVGSLEYPLFMKEVECALS